MHYTQYLLREKWPHSKFFWSAFFRIRTEYEHFLRSVVHVLNLSSGTPFTSLLLELENYFTSNVYLFKFNNRKTAKMCEICWMLTINTPNNVRRRSVVFINNFEPILLIFLEFLELVQI